MQTNHFAACAVLLLLAAGAFAAEESDLRIAPKPRAHDLVPEDFQAMIKRLAALPDPQAGAEAWAKNAEVAALAAQVHENPELFTRLIIPPNYPRAIPRADKLVRARAAAVLGQSGDLRGLEQLVSSAVYDPEDSVRRTSVKALRLLDDPMAVRKLMDLASKSDYQHYPWAIRQSACAALRRYGDREAIERLLRELSYELAGGNPLDHKNSLRGVPSGIGTENPLGAPASAPDLQLSEHDMYPVLSALKEVTGVSFAKYERDFKTWQ